MRKTCAGDQLCPRRTRRRSRVARGAQIRATSPEPLSTCSRRTGDGRPALRPAQCGLHAASRRIDHEAQENVALQVAEQMSDYLLRGAISNAVNFPSISAEEAPKLKPFVALAEKLGSFAGQLTETGLSRVQITYEGVVAQMNTKALTSAARRPAASDAVRRQRGLGAGRRQGPRHRRRGDAARSRRRLREPDYADGVTDRQSRHSPARYSPMAARAS